MMVGKDGKGRHPVVDTYCCCKTSGFIPKVTNLLQCLRIFSEFSGYVPKSYVHFRSQLDQFTSASHLSQHRPLCIAALAAGMYFPGDISTTFKFSKHKNQLAVWF